MSKHFLTRNSDNEPVCGGCGYRPAVLDDLAPIGKQWVAKKAILDHAESLNPVEQRSPEDAFPVREAVYPRAGVRQMEDGRWLLTLWDGPGIMHQIDEPEFSARTAAFDYGWMTIGACRQSGTNLNGWAAA